MNDPPLFIKACCELFTDNTTIHSSNSNLKKRLVTTESINSLLQQAKFNHMSLHLHKTKFMLTTTRQRVDNNKVLGMTTDSNISCSSHMTAFCKSTSKKIYQLSKIKHFMNLHTRKIFFHACIQSIIDYKLMLWDSASASILNPWLVYIRELSW